MSNINRNDNAEQPEDSQGSWSVQIGDASVEFKNPVQTGLDILKLADPELPKESKVLYLLRDGKIEDLPLDEKIDLRSQDITHFLAYREGGASFQIRLNGHEIEWDKPVISGFMLKQFAKLDSPAEYGVWRQVSGADDLPIDDSELVNLDSGEPESFFTGKTQTTEGCSGRVLPSQCRRYLEERGLQFEEVMEDGRSAVILKDFRLPLDRFDAPTADILIELPGGYPDAPPDMFYTIPWLKSATSGAYPPAADQPYEFGGQSWQRWSRHSDEWQAGRDGIQTMIKRVEAALEKVS